MEARDKFLTEAMGKCLHQNFSPDPDSQWSLCDRCGVRFNSGLYKPERNAMCFSTWDGFGKLWTWAQEQKWWEDFLNVMDVGEYIRTSGQGFTSDVQSEFINPDRLAHTVYEYLQMDE